MHFLFFFVSSCFQHYIMVVLTPCMSKFNSIIVYVCVHSCVVCLHTLLLVDFMLYSTHPSYLPLVFFFLSFFFPILLAACNCTRWFVVQYSVMECVCCTGSSCRLQDTIFERNKQVHDCTILLPLTLAKFMSVYG